MLVAILVIMCFMLIFSMAIAGSLIKIEKLVMVLAQAKLKEMEMWNVSERR